MIVGHLVPILFLLPAFVIGNNIPTLTEHKFEWASARYGSDCNSVNLHIRYSCLKDAEAPFETEDLFNHVCDDLIPAGLQKYYGGEISIGGTPYTVTVTASKENIDVQRVILKRELEDCVGKSYNNVLTPIVALYCDDIQFQYTLAHEFGHGILIPAGGVHYSLTHKASSTPTQKPRFDSDIANCDGSMTFDLMHYFQDYRDNCKDEDGIRGASFYEKAIGTEADKSVLLFYALNQTLANPQCGLVFGENCDLTSQCLTGLKCESGTQKCVECLSDADCDAQTQYCHDVNHEHVEESLNRCLDKRRPFETCERDEACLYGYCNLDYHECGSKGETPSRASKTSILACWVLPFWIISRFIK